MMTKPHLFLAVATLLAAPAASANFQSNVTIALQVKEQVVTEGYLRNGDIESTSRILTYRVTNRDLLEELRWEGVIDDVRGWRLVSARSDDWDVATFLVHPQRGEILLDDEGLLDDEFAEGAYLENSRIVYREPVGTGTGSTVTVIGGDPAVDPEPELVSGSGTYEVVFMSWFGVADVEFSAAAKETGSYRVVRLPNFVVPTFIGGARNVQISGFGYDEWAGGDVIIEGRVGFSAERFLSGWNPF
jgi:hypothetical protein